jgi:hypothetical protein
MVTKRIPGPYTIGVVWMIVMVIGLVSAHGQVPRASDWPNTDFDNTSIDLSEILSGGPPKDGIPSIDDPNFVSLESAGEWLDPKEPVIGVVIGDVARAYPIHILMWHEIVNDELAGVPLTVTFCPLCNASIVFDRRFEGQVLDFGTTGNLRKSDLVMYDRQTESWWQQLTGRAIVGELNGSELARVPAQIVAFDDFAAAWPEADVLSRETGYARMYGSNPYRGYDSIDDQPFLLADPADPRLPPMERVLNISLTSGDTVTHRLYPFRVFDDMPVVNDTVAGRGVVVFSRQGTLSALDQGDISASRKIPSATAFFATLDDVELTFASNDGVIVDQQTNSEWNLFGRAVAGKHQGKQLEPAPGGVHFAFAWLAFNPESEIFAVE